MSCRSTSEKAEVKLHRGARPQVDSSFGHFRALERATSCNASYSPVLYKSQQSLYEGFQLVEDAIKANSPLLTYVDVRLKGFLPDITSAKARQLDPRRRCNTSPLPFLDGITNPLQAIISSRPR